MMSSQDIATLTDDRILETEIECAVESPTDLVHKHAHQLQDGCSKFH